jgi:hypothetical protein
LGKKVEGLGLEVEKIEEVIETVLPRLRVED